MKIEYAKRLIKETKENYNLLAQDYARTRSFIPEDINNLAEYAFPGEKILDLGCANGRFFAVLKEKKAKYFGIDISENLIEIAKRKYPEENFQVADALNLPFENNFFDKIFSISVLHNIPSQEFRIRYLKEAKRVLKPNGLLILRVWNLWKRKESRKLFLKYSLLKLAGKSKLDFYDIFVPWKSSQGEIMAQRYFHCFTKNNIINLIEGVGFEVKEAWLKGKDQRANIYIIAKK